MKKLLSAVLVFCMVIPTTISAKTVQITMDSDKAYVSDEHIMEASLDSAAYIKDDITMVPISFITNEFGVEIKWHHDTKQVEIIKEDKTILLTIGDKNAYITSGGETTLAELISEPVIVNDRTMVPLRFVTENLGNTVDYIAPTRQVLITDEEPATVVGNVPIYKSMFRAYALLNWYYYDYYGRELFYKTVYSNLVNAAAVSAQWGIIDPNFTINPDDLKSVTDVSDGEWALSGILSADVVRLLNITGMKSSAYDMLKKSVTDESREEYYKANYVCAKHILIPKSEKSKAESVLKKALKGEDFDALVKTYGQDPGMINSPEGYVFTYGEMVQEFETAAFSLKEGEISGLVETAYGYHIIKKLPLPVISEETAYNVTDAIVNQVFGVMETQSSVVNNITEQELFEYLDNTTQG